MMLHIGRHAFPVLDLVAASLRYQQFRGAKSSKVVPEGVVHDDSGAIVARVSYNGSVWPAVPYHSKLRPLLYAIGGVVRPRLSATDQAFLGLSAADRKQFDDASPRTGLHRLHAHKETH